MLLPSMQRSFFMVGLRFFEYRVRFYYYTILLKKSQEMREILVTSTKINRIIAASPLTSRHIHAIIYKIPGPASAAVKRVRRAI